MRLPLIVAALLICAQQTVSVTLSISASSAGGLGGPDWWFVDIKPDGDVVVTPRATLEKNTLESAAMIALADQVRELRLLDLKDTYGTTCVDCSACILRISLGEKRKTIRVGDVSKSSDQDRAEAVRVLTLFKKVKELAGISKWEDGC